jgi:capsule polysaccharide export protein KpsE/RkpR
MDQPTDPREEAPASLAIEERVEQHELIIPPNGNGRTAWNMPAIDVAWLLWGNRRLLIRATLAGLLLFTAIAFLLPKRYRSTARLMPPDSDSMSALAMALPEVSSGEGGTGGAAGGSLMGMASRLLGLNTSGDLFIGVLESRTIEDHIIKKFGLMKLYSTKYPEDARKKLEEVTAIKEDSNTGIITLSVEDKSPTRAAAIVSTYIDELNKVLAQVNTSSAHRERIFLEQRLAEVKKQLDSSAKNFSEFASANTAIDIPAQGKAMVEAAADLQAQLIASESMLRGLQQIYTNNNSRVRQMQAQVEELQRQLNQIGGKDVNPNGGPKLSKNELYPSIRELPLLGVKYLDLYRQSKINEAVYELLTKQYEIAKMQEARDVPTAQVLDPADVPQKKSFPHRLLIMLGGMCFSFLAAGCFVLGSAYWDRTDPRLPWKVFAQEVYLTTKAKTWDSTVSLKFRVTAVRAMPWRWSGHKNGAGDHTQSL